MLAPDAVRLICNALETQGHVGLRSWQAKPANEAEKAVLEATARRSPRQASKSDKSRPYELCPAPASPPPVYLLERGPLWQAEEFRLAHGSFEFPRRNACGEIEQGPGNAGDRDALSYGKFVTTQHAAVPAQAGNWTR